MIRFRKINKQDKEKLKSLIFNEGKNYEQFLKLGWSVKQIINQIDKRTDLSIGCFDNNLMISFILGDLFMIEKISEYEILLLYVCKNYRNNGYGTILLKEIEENIKSLKKIYLEVAKNNIEGISFYKKMDFIETNFRKNYFIYEEKKIDAIMMEKNI